MITKTCECGVVFEYEPSKRFEDKRKYCDTCRNRKAAEWDAKQNQRVDSNGQPVPQKPIVNDEKPLKAENGEYQSTIYKRTVAPNSYEVGTVGNRFKLYFETPAELKAKMQELRDAGLMDLPLDQLPRD